MQSRNRCVLRLFANQRRGQRRQYLKRLKVYKNFEHRYTWCARHASKSSRRRCVLYASYSRASFVGCGRSSVIACRVRGHFRARHSLLAVYMAYRPHRVSTALGGIPRPLSRLDCRKSKAAIPRPLSRLDCRKSKAAGTFLSGSGFFRARVFSPFRTP